MNCPDIDVSVHQMKTLAAQLVAYSFPQVSPQDEETISVLKQREIAIDGYETIVYFNKCKYLDVEMETVQIYGKYFTFLPMSVVCKIVYKFLGDKELSLIEQMHYRRQGVMDEFSRKIYVWTVYYRNGEPISSPFVNNFETRTYEGLRFSHVDNNQIVFF